MSLDAPFAGTAHPGSPWANSQPQPKVGGYQDAVPDLEDVTYSALLESVRTRGVLVPIVVDQQGRIIDGHNRFRAANEVGVECPVVTVKVANHQDGRDVAVLLNTVRRHLDVETRRSLVAQLRTAGNSLRAIADAVGTSLGTVQRDLAPGVSPDTGADRSAPERTKGADGKSYPARRPAPAPSAPAVGEPVWVCGECLVMVPVASDLIGGLCVDCVPEPGAQPVTPSAADRGSCSGCGWSLPIICPTAPLCLDCAEGPRPPAPSPVPRVAVEAGWEPAPASHVEERSAQGRDHGGVNVAAPAAEPTPVASSRPAQPKPRPPTAQERADKEAQEHREDVTEGIASALAAIHACLMVPDGAEHAVAGWQPQVARHHVLLFPELLTPDGIRGVARKLDRLADVWAAAQEEAA